MAASWDERHAARDPIEARAPDPTLMSELGDEQPGRALDLATGDGRNAVWLAQAGWQVTAVDFSRVALERARAAAGAAGVDVDWIQADLLTWVPATEAFDLVTIAFLHLPPIERRVVYARAATALKPGGTLLVIGHDRSNLVDGEGGPQDPNVLFTPAEIAADLPGLWVRRSEVVRRAGTRDHGPLDAVLRATKPLSGDPASPQGSSVR